jgi:hypothetical protein
MRTLYEYIMMECEGGAPDSGMATPANTMGAGNPDAGELARLDGIPHEKTKIIRRRKKRRSTLRDYPM